MSEEKQFTGSERYVTKVDYPYLLLLNIMEIQDSIRWGRSAETETRNLISILKPSWVKKLQPKLKEYAEKRDNLLKELKKNKGSMGSYSYRARRLEIFNGYSLEVVNEVISIMDENSMLLITEKFVWEGGYRSI